jgi:hypothetical protein
MGVLLVSVKLEDDLRDDGSWMAWLASRVLTRPIEAAKTTLTTMDSTFLDRATRYIGDHVEMERSGGRRLSLAEFVLPSANAFADMFQTPCRLGSLVARATRKPDAL